MIEHKIAHFYEDSTRLNIDFGNFSFAVGGATIQKPAETLHVK